jgi:hypothetical protein
LRIECRSRWEEDWVEPNPEIGGQLDFDEPRET